MGINRNEPCPCGSGRKFKNCHFILDNANDDLRPIKSHEIYIDSWKINANHFTSKGYYTWLANKIDQYNPKLILDIGCGEGSGILALKKKYPDAKIISIDENFSCISEAKKLLEKEKYNVEVIRRLNFRGLGPSTHEILVEPNKLIFSSDILLIEADILFDQELYDFLNSLQKFDAITIWLIGTHLLRHECENIAVLNIASPGEYRIRVQNKTYEIADDLLKIGGVLQVADRTEEPDSEVAKKEFLDYHKERASVTSLQVIELDYIIYDEPISKSKINMEITLGSSGRMPVNKNKAITSIIAVKK